MIKLKKLIEGDIMENEQKVTKIYLDCDGVLCDFSKQYAKYLANDNLWKSVLNNKKLVSQRKLDNLGIDREEFNRRATEIRNDALSKNGDEIYDTLKTRCKTELTSNPAWSLIIYGGEDFWSTMDWMPGGQELVKFVFGLGIPTEILTAGQGPETAKGKQKWLQTHGLGDLKFNIVRTGKDKWEYAEEDYLLIDDMEENIVLFKRAGGRGVIHKNTSDSIKQIQRLI